VLKATQDVAFNTCAIVGAVGAIAGSFRSLPPAGLEGKKPYLTDFTVLDVTAFAAYNRSHKDLLLQSGPVYAITYEIRYDVRDRIVLYNVKSRLYYIGKRSDQWHEYAASYDDVFFSRRLLDEIQSQLPACAAKLT
jgi:hypothetical protein